MYTKDNIVGLIFYGLLKYEVTHIIDDYHCNLQFMLNNNKYNHSYVIKDINNSYWKVIKKVIEYQIY